MSTKLAVGKGWPNLMVGLHRELGSGLKARNNRGFLCRVELDTFISEDEARDLNRALSNNSLKDAVNIITSARASQGLPEQRRMIEAAIQAPGNPQNPQDPGFEFNIRVEGMLDHGKQPYMAKSVRFVMDVPVNDLPRGLTPGRIQAAVRQAIGTNPRAERIREAFERA